MTAGDDARTPGGWVPTEPPPGDGPADQPPTAAVIEPETQPLTRASIRAAQAQQLTEAAEERRRASLAEESAVPRGSGCSRSARPSRSPC